MLSNHWQAFRVEFICIERKSPLLVVTWRQQQERNNIRPYQRINADVRVWIAIVDSGIYPDHVAFGRPANHLSDC